MKPFGPSGQSAKRWCRGLYRGTVDFLRDPGPAVRTGRFSFGCARALDGAVRG